MKNKQTRIKLDMSFFFFFFHIYILLKFVSWTILKLIPILIPFTNNPYQLFSY